MPLRFGSEQEFLATMRFQAETSQAEQDTRRLGQVANEMTINQLREYSAQQSQMIGGAKELEKQTAQIQRNWWRTQRVLRASALIFRNITIAGTALWAPILAGAVKYAKEIEKIDDYSEAVADAWLVQTRQLENARLRIGRTSAQVLQPYLDDVTRLANQVAGFLERHPDVLEAALKTGVAVTTVGVLGTLVTQGIKMVVDVKFLSASATMAIASRQMDTAANKMLAASTGQQFSGGAKATGLGATAIGGTTLGAIGSLVGGVGLIVAGDVALASLFDKVYEWGEKGGPLAENVAKGFFVLERALEGIPILGVVPAVQDLKRGIAEWIPIFESLTTSAKKGTSAVVDMTLDLERLQKEGEGARIALELQRDLVKLSAKYADDRNQVIEDSEQKLLNITERYRDRIATAWERMQETIANLTENYNIQQSRADEDYYIQRSEIIANAHKDQQRQEQQFQEKLRQLRLDHQDRLDELVRNRDALGIVKEMRRYQREVDEETRRRQISLQNERQDTRDRLQELDRRHALERRRRFEDFQRKLADAREQYEQEKEEAAERRADELEELRKAQEERLEELRLAYEQEKRDAVNAAYEKVVLLRGAYDAEFQMRNQYNELILASTENFLQAMLDTFELRYSDLTQQLESTAPTRRMGGYSAGTGIHKLHQGEYVMNPGIVKAAEAALGGSITNAALQNLIAGGGRGSIVNFTLPGGVVTVPMMQDILKQNQAIIFEELERLVS